MLRILKNQAARRIHRIISQWRKNEKVVEMRVTLSSIVRHWFADLNPLSPTTAKHDLHSFDALLPILHALDIEMADKTGAYGGATGGGDTDFRRTWDREEYAAKAREREKKTKEEGKARYEAALAGKKYVRRASTPPDAKDTEARKARLDVSAQIG